jgi:hypothetical protein
MAVDVRALTTGYEEEVRRVRTEALLSFRDGLAAELEAHPDSRENLLNELRKYRAQFKEEGRQDMEDIVLDAMDLLTGWAARGVRV